MKKLIIGILMILSLISCGMGFYGFSPISNNINEQFYYKYDEFNECKFIISKNTMNNPIYVYIVKPDNKKSYLMVNFRYEGIDWIHFNKIILINDKGKKIRENINVRNKYKDVRSSSNYVYVIESIDFVINSKLKSFINNSKYIKMRLSGEYIRDYKINNYDTKILKDVIKYKDTK